MKLKTQRMRGRATSTSVWRELPPISCCTGQPPKHPTKCLHPDWASLSPMCHSAGLRAAGLLSGMGERGRDQGLGHNLWVPAEGGRAGTVGERLPVHPELLFSFREQRVTGTIVFILTGISVFLAPILKVKLCTGHQGPIHLRGHRPDASEVERGSPHDPLKGKIFLGPRDVTISTIFWNIGSFIINTRQSLLPFPILPGTHPYLSGGHSSFRRFC